MKTATVLSRTICWARGVGGSVHGCQAGPWSWMHSTHLRTSGNVLSSVLAHLPPWIERARGRKEFFWLKSSRLIDMLANSALWWEESEEGGHSVHQIWLTVGRQAKCRGTAASLMWWIRKATKELRESRPLKQSKTRKGNRSAHLHNLSNEQSSISKSLWCPEQETSHHMISAVMEVQDYHQELMILTRSANNFG